MFKFLSFLFSPFVRLKASIRANGEILADMNQEELREYKRRRDEIYRAAQHSAEARIRFGPLGWRL